MAGGLVELNQMTLIEGCDEGIPEGALKWKVLGYCAMLASRKSLVGCLVIMSTWHFVWLGKRRDGGLA